MSTTERSDVVFTVKEDAEGRPRIAIEPYTVDFMGEKSLGFDLPEKVDYETAKEIARYMNSNLSSLFVTNN